MGRLIDADALLNEFNPDSDALIDNILARMRIAEQPTAYSVDKVVEELETDSSVKLYGSQNSDNYMIPVKMAIEIVKQGGVADDVCEWKVKSNYYVTKCSHDTDVMYGLKQDFKYCPYCGKKIKDVE